MGGEGAVSKNYFYLIGGISIDNFNLSEARCLWCEW